MAERVRPGSLRLVNDSELAIRRMRYRLNRQGMLELDAWLAPLLTADLGDEAVATAVEQLLASEPDRLQAMMGGAEPLPEVLVPWLG